jgi:hypothetical protein
VEAEGRGQDQVGSIRLEQIGGTHISPEPGGDQGDYVHEGVGSFAALFGEACDFFHGQDVTGIGFFVVLGHRDPLALYLFRNAIVAGPVKMTCDPSWLAANSVCLLKNRLASPSTPFKNRLSLT